MNFNSLEFLVFFPLVLVLHWLLPQRFRWGLLLCASLAFYFCWDFWAGGLLVLAIMVSWACGLWADKAANRPHRRLAVGLALAVCLGCLVIFKYGGFFAGVAGLRLPLQLLLPVGISFYTFQALSYVLDVYRGRVAAERHLGYYALFVSFFPQLVAGPIERPENLLVQLRSPRAFAKSDFVCGGWLLLLGYFKKVAIADSLAPFVDRVYQAPQTALGPEIVVATLLFGVQIYCDFSGYSDIARGAARWLGIQLMENFRQPYGAQSIRAFWRRWHISLSRWFADYVYIPLGGNRRGLARQLRNLMLVFLLSGLWHGANWTFVLWGCLHGVYQLVEILMHQKFPCHSGAGPGRLVLAQLRTFLLVNGAWLVFRAESIADVAVLLGRLTLGWQGVLQRVQVGSLVQVGLLVLCVCVAEKIPLQTQSPPPKTLLAVFCMFTTVLLSWLMHLSAQGRNAFIYFQF